MKVTPRRRGKICCSIGLWGARRVSSLGTFKECLHSRRSLCCMQQFSQQHLCVSPVWTHATTLFTYTKRFGVSNFRNGQWHLWNCTISGCLWPGSPPHSRCTSTSVFSCLHSRVSVLVYVQWSHSCFLLDAKSSSKSHCRGCSPVCVPWSSPADNHVSFLGLFVRNYWRCGCNLSLPWDSGSYVCMENLPSAPSSGSGGLVLFLYLKIHLLWANDTESLGFTVNLWNVSGCTQPCTRRMCIPSSKVSVLPKSP